MMVRMPRGDIRPVRFIVNDPDGNHADIDFTEVYFTVKKDTRKAEYFFQKKLSTNGIVKLDNGDYQVKIKSDDTKDMAYGNYKFDVQLVYEDQLKETFVGDFILTEEVTFDENE